MLPCGVPSKHLLLIEDDPDFGDFLAITLRRKSYEVTIARTGREGLQKAVTILPDLVILDLSLPDMSGSSLLEVFRSFTMSALLPVIVVTSIGDPELPADILGLGADYFFTKPFSMSQLISVIERRLSVAAQTPLRPRPEPPVSPASERGAFSSALIQWLEKHHADADVTAGDAAEALAVSLSLLQKRMRDLFDTSFHRLLTNYRLARARHLIDLGATRMVEVAWQVGIPNQPHFTMLFRRKYGITPKSYALMIRKKGAELNSALNTEALFPRQDR